MTFFPSPIFIYRYIMIISFKRVSNGHNGILKFIRISVKMKVTSIKMIISFTIVSDDDR